ncbi:MAG: type II toxin-antitoxin system mRNA interferase toxin, RelE/StbE family [Nostoc sp.]|uniref:type II toxin-antitoxin system RelE/ParE family toxin n=1 Tax=Nostoc sp. TaxID=1180 RepID=UPI002FFA8D3B
MRQLVITPKFKRSFRKLVFDNPKLQERIEDTLQQMQEDVFLPRLATHSLEGKLSGLSACSCGYDCRIVFSLEIDHKTDEEVIILLDIDTHLELY